LTILYQTITFLRHCKWTQKLATLWDFRDLLETGMKPCASSQAAAANGEPSAPGNTFSPAHTHTHKPCFLLPYTHTQQNKQQAGWIVLLSLTSLLLMHTPKTILYCKHLCITNLVKSFKWSGKGTTTSKTTTSKTTTSKTHYFYFFFFPISRSL